jgi:flagellar export protein FliJ
MKPFCFPLQRVLEFRASRVEEEERKLGLLQQELAGLESAIEQVEQSRRKSAMSVAAAEASRGEELTAMTSFCARLERNRTVLDGKRSVCAQKLARQQENYLEARREHRLLEKLRDRQLAEWTRAEGRELDKVAGELYLARWESDKAGDRPRIEGE